MRDNKMDILEQATQEAEYELDEAFYSEDTLTGEENE